MTTLVVTQLLALLVPLLAAELGYRLGRRRGPEPEGSRLSAFQGAILGLLGLLVAFTMSMTEQRFVARQGIVVAEANAMGTAFLRTDLLPPGPRAEAGAALRSYAEARLSLYRASSQEEVDRVEEKTHALQAKLWSLATAEANARPTPGAALVVSCFNDLIDLDEVRLTALETHLPWTIILLLLAVAAVACATLSFGATRRGALAALVLPLLVSSALTVVFDLDRPRVGAIRVSTASLERAAAAMVEPQR